MNHRLAVLLSVAIALTTTLRPQTVSAADAAVPDAVTTVNKLVQRLAARDPAERDKASQEIEGLPPSDLPLVQAAAKRDDLLPEARIRLQKALVRLVPRCRLKAKELGWTSESNQWRSKMDADYYERDGHTDPKWDAAARQAFALGGQIANFELYSQIRPIIYEEKKQLDAAITAGCDDPGLLADAAILATDLGLSQKVILSYYVKAQQSSADGKVSPYTKYMIEAYLLRVSAQTAAGPLTAQQRAQMSHLMADMMRQYPLAMKMPGMPWHMKYKMADYALTTARLAHMNLKPIYDIVDPPLLEALPNNSYEQYIEGFFYVNYAWEARGGGLANTVTPQGWKDFADRLHTANDLLTRAADLDPTNPDPPTEMLTVVMGQDGDRDTMEKWFKRAMDANPDNTQACSSKMYYLEPKWHGDAESMLEFGHQCLDEGNWYGKIPLQLVNAHAALAKYEQDPSQYYRKPGVWEDIKLVYQPYLEMHSTAMSYKNAYCHYACLCGQWKIANQLFKEIGEQTDPTQFGGESVMNDMKRQAAALGGDNAPAQP